MSKDLAKYLAPRKRKKDKTSEPATQPSFTILDDTEMPADDSELVDLPEPQSNATVVTHGPEITGPQSSWRTTQEKRVSVETKPRQISEDLVNEGFLTVHRDPVTGKIIDPKEQAQTNAQLERTAKHKALERADWNKGLVQRRQRIQDSQTGATMSTQPLTRTADDAQLNEEQQATELWEDPGAEFLKKKRRLRLPEYVGPPAPPNRFGIKPGFRWDGVDRSNGFEKRFLIRQNERQAQLTRSYMANTSEM